MSSTGYIWCDTEECERAVVLRHNETLGQLRVRATQELGWTFDGRLNVDYCEVHA